MDNPRDRNDETSSHTLSTEPIRLQQLHAAPCNGNRTTSSLARYSTHIEEKESDVEKDLSNGDVDESAATEKIEVKKEAQETAALNEKEKDPNLVGWEGMPASSLDSTVRITN